MTVFINGERAEPLTFSSEKMINAATYMGTRKQEKKKKRREPQSRRARTSGATCATPAVALHLARAASARAGGN